MEIKLFEDGKEVALCTLAYHHAAWLQVEGFTCAKSGEPLEVRTDEQRIVNDREYHGRAMCRCCGELTPYEIRAIPNTIFGIEEDHRVLTGRPRVY